jgi:putative thioredoxin
VRAWLEQLGPGPADLAFAEGEAAEARGDLARAAEEYKRALAHEPAHADANAGLARVELAMRTGTVDEAALRARLEVSPNDVDTATAVADLEFARGELEAAVERLIGLVRVTEGEDRERVRLRLVELLDTLPIDDPRALKARRLLSAALY